MTTLLQDSLQEATGTLIDEGHVRINFPVDELIAPVVDGWLEFLALPPEVKNRWNVGDPADPDDGLVIRRGEDRHANAGDKYDNKSVFQYKGIRRLGSLLEHHGVHYDQKLYTWLMNLQSLHSHCLRCIRNFGNELDTLMPGFDFAGGIERATLQDIHCLGLLHYSEPQKIGDVVAKHHVDRNFITVHLDESHKGLLVRNSGKACFTYAKKPQEVLAFTGAKAEIMTGGKLRFVPHEVRATEQFVGKNRWAVIFFGHTDTIIPEDYFKRLGIQSCH